MFGRNALGLGAFVAGLVMVVGCGGMEIKYKPTTAAGAPLKSGVALKVAETRPADKGGSETNIVGKVRSGVGIPQSMADKHPDVAPHTVSDATADALKFAGVAVQPGGPKTLMATVTEYWMDGYMGYVARISVQYQLVDASGRPLWTAEIKGAGGGTNMFSSPRSMTLTLFQKALAELAQHAGEAFATPAFQAALASN
jgi:hypothetical protein